MLLCRRNGTIGHIIATCEDSGGAFLGGKIKKGIGTTTPSWRHKIAFSYQARVKRNTSLVQRIAVALVAIMRHLVLERTLDMSNTAMPQANQVAGGLISTQTV